VREGGRSECQWRRIEWASRRGGESGGLLMITVWDGMGWDGMMDERYISALSYIVTVAHSAIHSVSRCIKMSTSSYSRQSTKKSTIES
jgi:hypothetical protein